MDSSAEDWSEFKVEWEQYKEEYTLAGSALIRQLYACWAEITCVIPPHPTHPPTHNF